MTAWEDRFEMTDLVERLRTVDISWSETGEWCAEAADEIIRLREEVENLRRDAERYRWIKENLVIEDVDGYRICWSIDCAPSLETFDDVVDVMAKEE